MDYSKDRNNQFRGKERVVYGADGKAYYRDGASPEAKSDMSQTKITMNIMRTLACVFGGYMIATHSSFIVWGLAFLVPVGLWQVVSEEIEISKPE